MRDPRTEGILPSKSLAGVADPSALHRLTVLSFSLARQRANPFLMPDNLHRTLPEVLRDAADRYPDRAAIVDGKAAITFSVLKAGADRLSKSVIASGLEPGERFVIWAPNAVEWVVAALAAQQVGGVLVPINTRFKGQEAGDIVRRSGARLAFAMGEFLGVDYAALLAAQPCPELRRVVRLSGSGDELSLEAFAQLGDGVSDAELQRRIEAVRPADVSDVLYTSGTTGAPKGAMTTHGQNIATFMEWSEAVGLTAEDRYLVVNPFFHSFGYKAGWLAALLRGAAIYPEAQFDAARLLRRIERRRITLLPGPPTLFQSLLAEPGLADADLSSLRCAVTGAASVPVQLVRDMKQVLGFDEVYTAYGLTESSGVVSLCRAGDDLETIANTCGRAMRGVEIRIAGANGGALPAGAAGEVWVRGFNVMQGYLDDAAATAAAITPDGWLKTGDIGVLDERGYLKITDRLKDMYICGGFNCYPAEIENRLLDHPAIADVAVVGAPDERLGEVGHAFIVPAPDARRDPDEVLAWARSRMANYKVPRLITWMDALPRNASGKVQKFRLKGDAANA